MHAVVFDFGVFFFAVFAFNDGAPCGRSENWAPPPARPCEASRVAGHGQLSETRTLANGLWLFEIILVFAGFRGTKGAICSVGVKIGQNLS